MPLKPSSVSRSEDSTDKYSIVSEDDDDNEPRTSSSKKANEKEHDWDSDVICTVDGTPYWLVEEIRDVRVDKEGKLVYLVKWHGYPESSNSWEPEENCSMARQLIQDFHQQLPESQKHQLAKEMLMRSRPKGTGTIKKPQPTANKNSKTNASPAKPSTSSTKPSLKRPAESLAAKLGPSKRK